MDTTFLSNNKVSKCKSGPSEHAQSMSKRPTRLAYVGSFIYYLLYLPDPFPRGLGIDLQGSSTFLPFILSMHIDRLGLFIHLYGTVLYCLSICPGSWASATALCKKVVWCCTIAVSAWCRMHQLPGCECAVKRSCAPLGSQNSAYMNIYSYMQLYIHLNACKSFKHIYALYCTRMYIYLCFYAFIYTHTHIYIYVCVCVYRCILAYIWYHPISLLPLGRRVTYNSKGATQNNQMQVQHWPDVIALSFSIAS